jgi:hypothetical protein
VAALVIVLPILSLIAGVRWILYVATIVLSVWNLAFYVLPENLKMTVMKKRLLFVYVPAIAIICISVWDFIDIVILLQVARVASVFFNIVSVCQAGTFAMLVYLIAKNNPSLLN